MTMLVLGSVGLDRDGVKGWDLQIGAVREKGAVVL